MPEQDLRFPIGRFDFPDGLSQDERKGAIAEVASLPEALRAAVTGFSPEQWETPYRPEGWTVRQVVHHLPDSHMNAYVRFKLALTEFEPTIKPYHEAAWANLADTATTPPEVSLDLLSALHRRWVNLLVSLDDSDFARSLRHPEHGRTFTLDVMLALYAWHGRHHVAHITALASREGWDRTPSSV